MAVEVGEDKYFVVSKPQLDRHEVINSILDFISKPSTKRGGSVTLQDALLRAYESYRISTLEIAVKLLYAGGFYRLVAEVGGERGGPPRLWWVSLVERRVPECRTPLGGRCGPRRWENCSVCRRGVAAFGMPGSDTREGVTRDYMEAAEALGGGWRQWRPVFRPGEKLCPYCLVKRLAGLPRFFEAVAEALVGYRPPRRVVFPSTDDLAGLATKLAVLDAAVLLAALRGSSVARGELARWLELGDEGFGRVVDAVGGDSDVAGRIAGALSRLADVLAGVGYRSGLHERLAEALQSNSNEEIRDAAQRLVRGRWWTPRLLYMHVSLAGRVLEDARDDTLRGLAGALLFADMEVEAALEAPGVREALRSLGTALRAAARQARRAQLSEGEEAGRRLAEWLGVLAEAVQEPRVYYAAVGYDVDRIRDLLLGVSKRLEAGGEPLKPREYLEELVGSHWRVYARRGGKERLKGIAFLEKYLCTGLGQCRDPILIYHRASGASVLVSPSYHYALAGSLGYTFLRLNTVASRLGGVTVFVGGDWGVALLPAWLPRLLLPPGARRGYPRESARAAAYLAGAAGPGQAEQLAERLGGLLLESPAALFPVLAPRILWGSSGVPGFHPVKPRGRGRALYRVPALAGAGLSLGLRLSHRRDHLYAELEAVQELLNAAKELGGSRLVASMGRAAAAGAPRAAREAAAVVPLLPGSRDLEEALRAAGGAVAAAALMAGLVEKGAAGRRLLYGPEGYLGVPSGRLTGLLEEAGEGEARRLLAALVDVLLERHTRSGRGEAVEEAMHGVVEALKPGDVLEVYRLAQMLYDASQRSG